jgi:hypothetical protein
MNVHPEARHPSGDGDYPQSEGECREQEDQVSYPHGFPVFASIGLHWLGVPCGVLQKYAFH